MRIKVATYIFLGFIQTSCTGVIEPPNGTLNWYFSNTTGSRITMSVYDNVCKKTQFRIDLPRDREVPVTTCADENGRADIRYRRRTYRASQDNPWIDARVGNNQILVVRY